MTVYSNVQSFINATIKTIATTRGRLLAILVSHSEAAVQTVTLYDSSSASGEVLLKLAVHPDRSPCFVEFPSSTPPVFENGLTVEAGNCYVAVIAVS